MVAIKSTQTKQNSSGLLSHRKSSNISNQDTINDDDMRGFTGIDHDQRSKRSRKSDLDQPLQSSSSLAKNSSLLDSERLFFSGNSEHRGFFMLFWLGLSLVMFRSAYWHYKVHSGDSSGDNHYYYFPLPSFSVSLQLIGVHFLMFITSQFLVYLFTTPLASSVQNWWLSAIRHTCQLGFVLGFGVVWAWAFNWAWLYSGYQVMHTLVIVAKLHSFCCRFHRDQEPGGLSWARFYFVPSLVYNDWSSSDSAKYNQSSIKIRWGFVLEKCVAFLACLVMVYLLVELYIGPVLMMSSSASGHLMILNDPNSIFYNAPKLSRGLNMFEKLLELVVPSILCWLLMFYMLFECFCNILAELTLGESSSREFYGDWWNSVTFDEFARLWNKPVHRFLYVHLYRELMMEPSFSSLQKPPSKQSSDNSLSNKANKLKHRYEDSDNDGSSVKSPSNSLRFGLPHRPFTKAQAMFSTFLFSSVLHEFVMAVVTRRIVWFFFCLQMLQIPLIFTGKWIEKSLVKSHTTKPSSSPKTSPTGSSAVGGDMRPTLLVGWKLFANSVFWLSLMIGPSLVALIYISPS